MKSPHPLLFASHNQNKAAEIRAVLPHGFSLITLQDIGWDTEIPEPYATLEENATGKVNMVYIKTQQPCFAEDSGLEVEVLGGKPGILSARYAGLHGNSEANIQKLLHEMKGESNRKAAFRAVIAYQSGTKKVFLFEGTVEGTISDMPLGQGGFGYDPVFIPHGFDRTFGQLAPGIKNAISHRKHALQRFLTFLQEEPFL